MRTLGLEGWSEENMTFMKYVSEVGRIDCQ